MSWEKWVLIGWLILGALIFIGRTGRPRPVVTPAAAAFGALEFGAAILLVVWS